MLKHCILRVTMAWNQLEQIGGHVVMQLTHANNQQSLTTPACALTQLGSIETAIAYPTTPSARSPTFWNMRFVLGALMLLISLVPVLHRLAPRRPLESSETTKLAQTTHNLQPLGQRVRWASTNTDQSM